MKRIDLDDLPPRLAQLLLELDTDEELLLVQGGIVVGRLSALAAPAPEPEEPPGDERAAEVFEQFRSLVEDEF